MDKKEIAFFLTAATGRLFCDFGEFHKWAEKRLGRPIFTHEFSSYGTALEELRESITEEEWRQICRWFAIEEPYEVALREIREAIWAHFLGTDCRETVERIADILESVGIDIGGEKNEPK